jgi:hypothetical protein
MGFWEQDVAPHDQVIAEAALAHGVDERIYRRMIGAESGGNPLAVSPKGAMGAAQLMPDTAKGLGVQNPYDFTESIYGGAKYLRQMLDTFGGNYELAVAAYNAGPANVSNGAWKGFKETTSYVHKVLGDDSIPTGAPKSPQGWSLIDLFAPSPAEAAQQPGTPSWQQPHLTGNGDFLNLHNSMINPLYAMADEFFQITGKPLQIDSGYRSPERQAELRKQFEADRAAGLNPLPVGTVEGSLHPKGLAIDVSRDQVAELSKSGLLEKYGFEAPVPGEPFHLQLKPSWEVTSSDALAAKQSIFSKIAGGFTETAKNLKVGYDASVAGLYNTVANLPMILDKIKTATSLPNDPLAESFGDPKNIFVDFKKQEDFFRTLSALIGPKPEDLPDSLTGKVVAGIGSAPMAIAQYAAGSALAGPVAGFSLVNALGAIDKGVLPAAKAALAGFTMGVGFKAVEPLVYYQKLTGLGTIGALDAAMNGGDAKDITAAATVMVALGIMSNGGNLTAREALKDAVAQFSPKYETFKANIEAKVESTKGITDEQATEIRNEAYTKYMEVAFVEAQKHLDGIYQEMKTQVGQERAEKFVEIYRNEMFRNRKSYLESLDRQANGISEKPSETTPGPTIGKGEIVQPGASGEATQEMQISKGSQAPVYSMTFPDEIKAIDWLNSNKNKPLFKGLDWSTTPLPEGKIRIEAVGEVEKMGSGLPVWEFLKKQFIRINPEDIRVAQDQEALKVEKMYEQADSELKDIKSFTGTKLWQSYKRMVTDVSSNVKKILLEQAGEFGKEAEMRLVLSKGADSKVQMIMDELTDRLYKNLTPQEELILNRIIQSRRTIDIEAYKPDMEHPGGLKTQEHLAYLNDIPLSISRKLTPIANEYFQVMNEQVKALQDAGIISEEQSIKLQAHDYSPRQFIQYLDPDNIGFDNMGRKISIPDSGIKSLEGGSEKMLENNSRLLLSQVVTRTQNRIFRNNANMALLEVAKQIPGNDIVRLPKYGEKPGPGETMIKVMEDGAAQEMIMPDKFAKEWVKSDPLMSHGLANFFGWISGNKILKALATGLNPGFALTNIPRDIFHIWLVGNRYGLETGYSQNLPYYLVQMGNDVRQTFKDAVFKTGAYKDYISQGGGMELLTYQGRITPGLTGIWGNIQKYAGWLGELSETMTRLAVRNRALKEGATPEQATFVARSYLDFSQGGSGIKALDSTLPYLNASVQGTRMIFRSALDDPKSFGWKIAQLGTLAMGFYFANQNNKEAYEAVPMKEKATNFIITTPFSYKDQEGNKRWLYFRIAKDQGQRIFTNIFEALAAKSMGNKVDPEEITSGLMDFIPNMPWSSLPPTIAAILGYASNKDFWRNTDYWKGPKVQPGHEIYPTTHPVLAEIGKYTNFSPERLKSLGSILPPTNTFIDLTATGLRELMGGVPKKQQEKMMGQILTETPMLNKILRGTDPYEPQRKLIEDTKIEESTRRYDMNLEVQDIVDKNMDKSVKERHKIYEDYVRAHPKEDGKRLIREFKDTESYHDIPDRRWWLNLKHMPGPSRALVFWSRYKDASPEDQDRLQSQLKKLPGIASPEFGYFLKKEIKEKPIQGATQ